MIPKIIHYCWFGNHPLGKLGEKCLKSWRHACPDYEIVMWNEENSPVNDNQYVQQAYSAKRWAFVSDYVRLKVLSEYGGIYLDTDVELLGPLDKYLDQAGFLGFEGREYVATCVIACAAEHPFFCWAAEQYDKRLLLKEDGFYDDTTNTTWLTEILRKKGLKSNGLLQNISNITIYPPDVFCPKDLQTGKLHLTENSVAVHHFAGSWMTPKQRIHTRTAQFLGVHCTETLKRLLRRNK